jgi:hypothetical protein
MFLEKQALSCHSAGKSANSKGEHNKSQLSTLTTWMIKPLALDHTSKKDVK